MPDNCASRRLQDIRAQQVELFPHLYVTLIDRSSLKEFTNVNAAGWKTILATWQFGTSHLSHTNAEGETIRLPEGTPHLVEHAPLFRHKFGDPRGRVFDFDGGRLGGLNGMVERESTSWWLQDWPISDANLDVFIAHFLSLSDPHLGTRDANREWAAWLVKDVANERQYRIGRGQHIRWALMRALWPHDDLGADPIGHSDELKSAMPIALDVGYKSWRGSPLSVTLAGGRNEDWPSVLRVLEAYASQAQPTIAPSRMLDDPAAGQRLSMRVSGPPRAFGAVGLGPIAALASDRRQLARMFLALQLMARSNSPLPVEFGNGFTAFTGSWYVDDPLFDPVSALVNKVRDQLAAWARNITVRIESVLATQLESYVECIRLLHRASQLRLSKEDLVEAAETIGADDIWLIGDALSFPTSFASVRTHA